MKILLIFLLLPASLKAGDITENYNKETRALYLRIIRANSKSAIRKVFLRNPDYVELAYYKSDDSLTRSYCLSLLFLKHNIDTIDVPYNQYLKHIESLSVKSRLEGIKELRLAISNMCNVARELFKEVENEKNKGLVENKPHKLGFAKYYSRFDKVIKQQGKIQFNVAGEIEQGRKERAKKNK